MNNLHMKEHKMSITATNIIIAVCVVMYLLDKYVFVFDGGMFESPSVSERILGLCGGNVFYKVAYYNGCIADGEWWRVFTYMFVHIFSVHLIVNMLSLAIVGNSLEKVHGPLYVVLLFFGIGIADVLITNMLPFFEESSITGGASGAVFGLIGICLVEFITGKGSSVSFKPISKIYLAAYGVIFTYLMGSWTMCAHNIGFVMGILVGIFTKSISHI